jgi:hypothetical protein
LVQKTQKEEYKDTKTDVFTLDEVKDCFQGTTKFVNIRLEKRKSERENERKKAERVNISRGIKNLRPQNF